MLGDLRDTIARLAARTYDDRTGHRAAAPQRPRAAKPRATSSS
jgi:hypothetical protein